MRQAKLSNVIGLILWFGVTFLAATLGAIASVDAKGFYGSLDRPAWAPPGWLFGPVWTLLYILMATAAFSIWLRRTIQPVKPALILYLIQLALNALWSWIFFRWHLGALAVGEIALLWVVLLITCIKFWRIRPWAGPCWCHISHGLRLPFASLWKHGAKTLIYCDERS